MDYNIANIIKNANIYCVSKLPYYPKLCIRLRGNGSDDVFYEEFYEKLPEEQHQILLVAIAMNNLLTSEKLIDMVSWFDVDSHNGIYLKVAVYNKAYDTATYLIKLGANVEIDNNYIIQLAAAQCRNGDLLQLIIDRGADIHANNNAVICYAAHTNAHKNIKILIDNGADINTSNGYLLEYAIMQQHESILQYLLDKGIDASSPEFLSMAIDSNYFNGTKLLLEYGADIGSLDQEDYIAAIKSKNLELIELLASYGANFTTVNDYTATHACHKTIDTLVNLGVSLNAICNIFGDN